MRLTFLAICIVAFGIVPATAAQDKFTFGPVPPPSPFPANIDYSAGVTAAPVVPAKIIVPPARTNSIPVPTAAPVAESSKPAGVTPAASPAPPKLEPVKPAVEPPPTGRVPTAVTIVTGGGLDGKVAAVDAHGRFVVLNFPLGEMPPAKAVLNVYRHGVKVGELVVTGPQRDDNTVADVVSGDLQVGDAARDY